MKKRIACVILTLIMLVSLVPTAALTASAATWTISDSLVSVIKGFEGFSATAYQDNSQWSIGYGTVSKEGAVLPGATEAEQKAEAETLLRAELEKVAATVNSWASARGLTLNQGKFDALVSFSYNCGTGWMSADGVFRKAVLGGTTGNDFLNAICLWANSGGVPSTGLLNRRLAEANMYLNGQYSATPPSNYTYVIYDANGGSVDSKMQGYDSSTKDGVAIKATATRDNYAFAGWYTAKTGGTKVTALGTATAGKTLYAHWNTTVTVTSTYVNVRAEANANATTKIIDKLNYGEQVVIVSVTTASNGALWGELEDGGWIALEYTNYVGEAEEEEKDDSSTGTTDSSVIATGTVINCTNLNVREKADIYSSKIGTLPVGTKVSFYEFDKNEKWGRCDKGWVALEYISLDKTADSDDKTESDSSTSGSTSSSDVIATGVVNSTTNLNIRAEANIYSTKVGSLPTGTKVSIYETTKTNGVTWGRIDKGWVCMQYVTLDAAASETINGTGTKGTVVNCSTGVNIRASAGMSGALVGTAAVGSTVTIYETTKVNNVLWGRCDKGWVCMQYIKLSDDSTSDSTTTGGTTSGSTTTTAAFESTSCLTNLNAVASEEVVVYDASGAKTTTTIKKGSSFTVTALGLFSTGKDIDSDTVMAQTSLGYVVASKLTLSAPSATYYAKYELEYVSNGTTVTIEDGEALVVTYVHIVGKSIYATIEEHNIYVSTEDLSTGANTNKYIVTEDTAVYVYNTENKLVDSGTIVEKGEKLYIDEIKTIDSVQYGYYGLEDCYILASKLKSVETGAIAGGTTTDSTTSGTTGVYTGTISGAATVNVRSTPGVTYTNKVGSVALGTKVTVYEQTSVNGAAWGRIGENQWVAMMYVTLDAANSGSTTGGTTTGGTTTGGTTGSTTTSNATGIVNSNTNLNVRTGPGTQYAKVTSLTKGTTITIYEQQIVNGTNWGRTDQGWVCLNYVTMTGTGSTGTGVMGTIARCFYAVNVRSAAGTGNAIVGQIMVGSRVEVYEQVLYSGQYWGRVSQGWICMEYVLLDSELPETETSTGNGTTSDSSVSTGTTGGTSTGTTTGTTTTGTIATATVVGESSSFVSVYAKVGDIEVADALAGKTSVSISELKISSGTLWAKISQGWVEASNLTITSAYATVGDKDAKIYANLGGSASVAVLEAGKQIKITAVGVANGDDVWLQTKDGGWIDMDYVTLSATETAATTSTTTDNTTTTNTTTGTSTTTTTTAGNGAYLYTGTVVGTTSLRIRSTPSTSGTELGTYSSGQQVVIYETATAENMAWGRCDAGWICLVYVDLAPTAADAIDTRVVQIGGCNIREGAGVTYASIGTYAKCTIVDIYEIDGVWARTKDGWVALENFLG